MGHATFSISNASSVMGLVRIVVGHVMRTNTVPDALATCFKSLKIMWLFSAQAHEIKNIAIQDNIDQHLRRRHTEMDNIFQVKSWMDIMPAITKNRLDPNKALDVCKFATIFGTPTQPLKCDPWLKALLREKPPTFENKLDAITTPGVTVKFLLDAKATIAHPEMKDYKKVASRVRAVKGFGEFMRIHEKICEEAPFSCLQGSTPRCPSKSRTTIQAGFDCMFSFGF